MFHRRGLLLRHCIRTIHTSPPYYSTKVGWREPFRAFRIRNPYSLAIGTLSLTFFVTFPLWFRQLPASGSEFTQNDDLPAPVRGKGAQVHTGSPPSTSNPIVVRSVSDFPTSDNFPEILEVDGKKFKLVAWGVRTVSFLRVQVYNVGLYIPESEYAVLPTWSLTADGEPWTSLVRIYSYPLILRIIPVRNTDYAHLRDGFVKSTMSRLKKYDEGDLRKDLVDDSVVKFKALFPRSRLKKGEVLSIMQQGPELKLYAGENMEELFGGVMNDDLARGLMSAYLVGDNVVSPDLQKKLKQKILQIAAQKQDGVEGVLKQRE